LSEKAWVEKQWVSLIGDDTISHARLIYDVLHSENIPRNIAIPLIKDLGLDESVVQDINLSESDFVSKYDDKLYLPIIITDNNFSAISSLLRLFGFNVLKSEITTNHAMRFIFDLDDKSIATLALYYIVLKKSILRIIVHLGNHRKFLTY